jgi:hypothetical protein
VSRAARIGIVAVALVVAVAAFVALRPGDEGPGDGSTATAPDGATTGAAPAAPRAKPIPLVRLRRGRPAGGRAEIEARRGERIRFAAVSDVDDELHVHGYDLTRRLPAGRRVTVSFAARLEGAFEVESHDFERQVAVVRVRP